MDLRNNRLALDAQLEWAGLGHLVENKRVSREDLSVFESAFNAACASIARGELGQAEVLLKRAYRKCLGSIFYSRLFYSIWEGCFSFLFTDRTDG